VRHIVKPYFEEFSTKSENRRRAQKQKRRTKESTTTKTTTKKATKTKTTTKTTTKTKKRANAAPRSNSGELHTLPPRGIKKAFFRKVNPKTLPVEPAKQPQGQTQGWRFRAEWSGKEKKRAGRAKVGAGSTTAARQGYFTAR
jgi:hypothetical protein